LGRNVFERRVDLKRPGQLGQLGVYKLQVLLTQTASENGRVPAVILENPYGFRRDRYKPTTDLVIACVVRPKAHRFRGWLDSPEWVVSCRLGLCRLGRLRFRFFFLGGRSVE
jgi:hypothetical protein